MGSITEEQLIQMVIDFIESESTPQKTSEALPLINNHRQHTYIDTLQEIIWSATDSEVEILEKVLMYVRNMPSLREPSDLKKWIVLRLKVDGLHASLCRTSWVSFLGLTKGCLTKGGYEFIDVTMIRDIDVENGLTKPMRLIIDMDFRSQFELARPTASYKRLVDSLPPIFVGTEEKLKNVVSLLCSAAKQSLKESGLHIPPWRKASYMLTKWFSDNCQKVSISPNMVL